MTCNNNIIQNKFLLFFLLCLCFTCIAVVVLAYTPPISRDALTHHLAVPKLYLLHGGIYEIPNLKFSYYPMNLDLLYIIPLYFGNDILPKFIHFLFALGTGWLIYTYLKQHISKTYGLIGCLLFLSIPIILKLSITVYVDLGLIFFSTAALLMILRWSEENFKIRYIITAAICCGLAMGTKYNGLITFLLLSALIPLLYQRVSTSKNNLSALHFGIIFAGIAVLTFSPWLIRNFLWTGNPLFPLFDNIFHPGQYAEAPHIGILKLRQLLYHETPSQILLLPLRIFFEGKDNVPQLFDGKLNPFLLLLPPLAFISAKKSITLQKILLVVFSFLFLFIAVFQTTMRIRYIAPIIPPLIILSLFGLNNLRQLFRNEKIGSLIVGILLVVMFAYNGNYLIGQFKLIQPISYISGKISRDEYITHFRPEYPVIQFANQMCTRIDKVLCLFMGNRGYYMDFSHFFDLPTNTDSFLNQTLLLATKEENIRRTLLQNGYTWILLRNDLTNKWLQNLQQHKKTVILFFQHDLKLMYTAGGYSLFSLKK